MKAGFSPATFWIGERQPEKAISGSMPYINPEVPGWLSFLVFGRDPFYLSFQADQRKVPVNIQFFSIPDIDLKKGVQIATTYFFYYLLNISRIKSLSSGKSLKHNPH